jgi:hypothetical protein
MAVIQQHIHRMEQLLVRTGNSSIDGRIPHLTEEFPRALGRPPRDAGDHARTAAACGMGRVRA